LLHVIHEIHAQRAGRARVERREDARLAVGGYLADLLEPGLTQQLHREVAPFSDPIVFRGNRRLVDPSLQPGDRLLVTPLDLRLNVVQAAGRQGRPRRQGERRGTRRGALEEGPPVHRVFHIASV
jgi:hypothetical protein